MDHFLDKSDLEPQVRDFLTAAASSTPLAAACDVLLMHANDLAIGEARQGMVLVSIDGLSNIEESMSCVRGRIAVEGAEAIRELAPSLFEVMGPIFADLKQRMPKSAPATDDEKAVMAAMVLRTQETPEFRNSVSKAFVDYLALGADFLSHTVLKFGVETRQRQIAATGGVVAYDAMVKALDRLEVFAPRARVVLCPRCLSIEIAVGRHVGTLMTCTKCGSAVSSVSLLFPRSDFQALKLASRDLPLFASAFLRQRAVLPTEIAPCRQYHDAAGPEVDVAIDELHTAIEVKVFNSPATFSPQKAENEAPSLATQLEGYIRLGFKRVICLMNIAQPSADSLLALVRSKHHALKNVRLEAIGAPFNVIRDGLVALGGELGKAVTARVERKFGLGVNTAKEAGA